MRLLASNAFARVLVHVRGVDYPIELTPDNGLSLMDYLASEGAGPHVKLNDTRGVPVVVRTTQITLVEPVPKADLDEERIKQYV